MSAGQVDCRVRLGGCREREEVTGEASPGARRLKHPQAPGDISLDDQGPVNSQSVSRQVGEGAGWGLDRGHDEDRVPT